MALEVDTRDAHNMWLRLKKEHDEVNERIVVLSRAQEIHHLHTTERDIEELTAYSKGVFFGLKILHDALGYQ